jgi:uncharacterized membrane protein YuzA (DUF378 family)
MKCINFLAFILVILGAINWGLWGFFQFDFVAYLAKGNTSGLARLIYAIVGLAGIWSLKFLGHCKTICCGSHDHNSKGGPGGCCKM